MYSCFSSIDRNKAPGSTVNISIMSSLKDYKFSTLHLLQDQLFGLRFSTVYSHQLSKIARVFGLLGDSGTLNPLKGSLPYLLPALGGETASASEGQYGDEQPLNCFRFNSISMVVPMRYLRTFHFSISPVAVKGGAVLIIFELFRFRYSQSQIPQLREGMQIYHIRFAFGNDRCYFRDICGHTTLIFRFRRQWGGSNMFLFDAIVSRSLHRQRLQAMMVA